MRVATAAPPLAGRTSLAVAGAIVGSVEAALFIAAVSLVLAAASLGWQIATWLLDGRRVRVALVHGVMGRGAVASGKVRRRGQPRDIARHRRDGFDGPEVVGIAVTNVGRAPVRIDRYRMKLRRGGLAFTPVADLIGPELPHRLPPGETETWYALAEHARRLVTSARAVGMPASDDVVMTVELGTGDTKRTHTRVVL